MSMRGDGVGAVEVGTSVTPSDHHGVDAVLGGALDVV